MNLTPADLQMFARLGISPELLERAGVERVTDAEARQDYGITGPGDMGGIAFPYFSPMDGVRRTCRVRRDHPEMESGKPRKKYVVAYGDRRRLYFARGCAELVSDPSLSVVLVEAEKSALALTAWAERNQHELLPVAMGGCFGWRGRIGKQDAADGKRVDETGPLPDLAVCRNRDVVVMLDSNEDAKSEVRAARFALVRELEHMGARVRIATVPALDGVNGPDDLIAVGGDEAIRYVLELAQPAAELAVAEVEVAIGDILAAKPNISAEQMRRALDAVADVSDHIQRATLEGRLATAVRGCLSKKVVLAEVLERRQRREQKQIKFAQQARVAELRQHPEDGAALLSDIEAFCRRFYVMAEAHYVILPVWVLHTHVYQQFDFTPYLHIRSSTKRCGKTNVMSGLSRLVWKPWGTGSTSVAALARRAEEGRTLLLDESDASFKGPAEYAEALRGLLNVRFSREGVYTRCVGEGGTLEVKDFRVYGPTAIAGIGNLPDTVTDRCIPIVMRRKALRETAERFRSRTVRPLARDLAVRIERWAHQAADRLISSEPTVIEELHDRAWDVCEPLMAIAELQGGDWPARLRRALLEIYGSDAAQDDDVGVQLLQDIRVVFDAHGEDKISSADLVASLKELETSPWADWGHGKGITTNGLGRLLRNLDINSRSIRVGDKTPKGYLRESFEDAWGRYLCAPPHNPAFEPQHPPQINDDARLRHFFEPQQEPSVADAKNASGPLLMRVVADVADESRGKGNKGIEVDL